MYICICNAITDKQVVEAIENGATSLPDLQAQLGVATCCGCCSDTVLEYINESKQVFTCQVQEVHW